MQEHDDTAAYLGLGKGHWEASAAPSFCTVLDRGNAQLERIEASTGVSLASSLPPSCVGGSDWLLVHEAATSPVATICKGTVPTLARRCVSTRHDDSVLHFACSAFSDRSLPVLPRRKKVLSGWPQISRAALTLPLRRDFVFCPHPACIRIRTAPLDPRAPRMLMASPAAQPFTSVDTTTQGPHKDEVESPSISVTNALARYERRFNARGPRGMARLVGRKHASAARRRPADQRRAPHVFSAAGRKCGPEESHSYTPAAGAWPVASRMAHKSTARAVSTGAGSVGTRCGQEGRPPHNMGKEETSGAAEGD
ncbi:hypothetical protein OPT61_g8725 [Boeremia exigua]|uniref:Uncharacterized protein n=1 Tax=Boeremia exigua TaxID=749465 RepID=A0ACC2HXN7_9PLEO|nr:hypothetical protein OPT61_g8725 [Boeremia exigua]